jgi:putative ATPase
MEGFGHGVGYLYPHAYRDHWVEQQYMPRELQGRLFYTPTMQGYEATIYEQVMRRRDAQLDAMMSREREGLLSGEQTSERLTHSPADRATERWLARTVEDAGARLAELRDGLYQAARLARHHVVLDLSAGTGLLMWEALRCTPEGGVWARAEDEAQRDALLLRASRLPELNRPSVLSCRLLALERALGEEAPGVRFDRIVGAQALGRLGPSEREAALGMLSRLVRADGVVALLEHEPGVSQRVYQLRERWSGMPDALYERWREAEEALYEAWDVERDGWDAARWRQACEGAGWGVEIEVIVQRGRRVVLDAQLERWCDSEAESYLRRLDAWLSEEEREQIKRQMFAELSGQVVPWSTTTLRIIGRGVG